MVATHGDHENSWPVLRDTGVSGRVQDLGVPLTEPVPGLLNLGLDPLEGAAIVVRPKVLDVLQQQDLGFVLAELSDQANDVQEKQSAIILESKCLARCRKRLARKSSGQNVNGIKFALRDSNLLDRLMQGTNVRKVGFESGACKLVLLVRPKNFRPDMLKCFAEATDGCKQASHGWWLSSGTRVLDIPCRYSLHSAYAHSLKTT
jgi:hypothetical protein